MKRLLVLVVLAFGLTASKCSPNPPTPVVDAAPAPSPVADAAPVPVVPSCASACARAAAIGCDFAAPSPKGVSCVDVCQNAQQFVPWDFVCRMNIKTCADVLNCH